MPNGLDSAAPLLFFRNISRLIINEQTLEKQIVGPGPIANSQWVRISGTDSQAVCLIQSQDAAFPADAIDEIRRERNSADFNLPPCRVELVLGLSGGERLFVVLPTSVKPPLPFSCNAPFLQDPARIGIKDPAVSPTNRWLLQRLGELAAESMLEWLDQRSLSIKDRADAYRLVPERIAAAEGLDKESADVITAAFEESAGQGPLVLMADGHLALPGHAVAPPRTLYEVWSPETILEFLGDPNAHLLSPHVSAGHQSRLEVWGWLNRVDKKEIIDRLSESPRPRRPLEQQAMLRLWQFVEESVSRWDSSARNRVRIIPVEGRDDLYNVAEVARLAGTRSRLSIGSDPSDDDDRRFLSHLLCIVEQDWLDHLSMMSLIDDDAPLKAALSLLAAMRLDAPTPWEKVVQLAANTLFTADKVIIADAIRLAHIAAAINVQVPSEFQFVTKDGFRRNVGEGLICDPEGKIEELLPNKWAQSHLLHEDYSRPSLSCRREQWQAWVASVNSHLSMFPQLLPRVSRLFGENKLRDFLEKHQGAMPKAYQLKTRDFQATDYNFDNELLGPWQERSFSEPDLWARILQHILTGPVDFWKSALLCEMRQTGSSKAYLLDCGRPIARWIVWFQRQKCLPDTFGVLRAPAELLLRSPDTEPLMGVEPFVRAEYDTEAKRPLLKLLGVRDTPSGPERIIARIRDLATVNDPPIHEVAKWYDALDRILVRCRPDDLARAKQAFVDGRLVLTEEGDWASLGEVFLAAGDGDVCNVSLVHSSVRNLSMWARLGVPERPSLERVIEWIKCLPSGDKLDIHDFKQVRSSLQRNPAHVWQECGHWLNLEGVWTPTTSLQFRNHHAGIGKIR